MSSLGWLGTLADVVTGRAIMALTPGNVYCQTVSLRLDVGDRPPVLGERLIATGEVIGATESFALCQARIQGEDGRTVALGTARFALTEVDGGDGREVGAPRSGSVATSDDLRHLLQMEVLESEPGRVAFGASPSEGLGNQNGVVHGGVHTGYADVLLTQAVASASSADSPCLLDLTLTYHRPIPIDGTSLRMEAAVDRLGRRVAVASGTILSPAGTVLTSVSGTFALPNSDA